MLFYLGVGFIIFYCMACYYDFLHAQNLIVYNYYIKEQNTKILYPKRGGDYAEKCGMQDKYFFPETFCWNMYCCLQGGCCCLRKHSTFITQMEHSSERGEAICQRN